MDEQSPSDVQRQAGAIYWTVDTDAMRKLPIEERKRKKKEDACLAS